MSSNITWLKKLQNHAKELTPPPPEGRRQAILYGFVQPWLGVRILLQHRHLLRMAIGPVVIFICICFALAVLQSEGLSPWLWLKTSYLAIIAAAPLPPVLFVHSYARLAAETRNQLGHGPRTPYLRGMGRAVKESILQTIVIAIGLAPLILLLKIIPGIGTLLAAVLTGLWTLHWIVVEALDNAHTLPFGQTETNKLLERQPWFLRVYKPRTGTKLRRWHKPLQKWSRLLARLTKQWHHELLILETHPWICLGFSLGIAVLLAIPGLNLLFRPAIIVASARLRGYIDLGRNHAQPHPNEHEPTEQQTSTTNRSDYSKPSWCPQSKAIQAAGE